MKRILALLFFSFLFTFLFTFQSLFSTTIILTNWEMYKGDISPENFSRVEWVKSRDTYFERISKTNITLTFRTVLPELALKEPALSTFHFDQYVEIYIETNKIYERGSKENNLSSFNRHFVILPQGTGGKTIYIKVFSSFQNIGFSYPVEFGETRELLLNIVKRDIDEIILSSFFLIVGVATIFLSFSTQSMMLHFISVGIFSVLLGLTTLCRTEIRAFIFNNNPFVWGYLELLSLYALPPPLCYFIHLLNKVEERNPFKNVMLLAAIFTLAFAVITGFLSIVEPNILLKSLDLFDLLGSIALLTGFVNVIYLVFFKKNREARNLFVGLILMAVFLAIDLLQDQQILPRIGFTSHWGVFIFVLTMINILRIKVYNIHNDLKLYSRQLELDKIYIKRSNEELSFLTRELEVTQKEVIFKLCEIAEARSQETGNHIIRVSQYSRFVAEQLGLSEKDIKLISLSSPMHDIGKLAIPDSILNKPSKLTEEEFEIIKTHTTKGYEMLKKSKQELFTSASIIALQHHERYDGKGYPNGLKGGEIHIYGRIVAIADVFDSLSCDRVYKKAWPIDKVIEYITQERGKQFDPELVDILVKSIDLFLKIKERYADNFEFHFERGLLEEDQNNVL